MTNNKRVLKDLTQPSTEELIKALLDKNAALEAQLAAGVKATGVNIIELHGKPFLEFSGPFKSFSLSLQKCERIVKFFPSIKAFYESKGKKI